MVFLCSHAAQGDRAVQKRPEPIQGVNLILQIIPDPSSSRVATNITMHNRQLERAACFVVPSARVTQAARQQGTKAPTPKMD